MGPFCCWARLTCQAVGRHSFRIFEWKQLAAPGAKALLERQRHVGAVVVRGLVTEGVCGCGDEDVIVLALMGAIGGAAIVATNSIV
jgi:hypothetical protein